MSLYDTLLCAFNKIMKWEPSVSFSYHNTFTHSLPPSLLHQLFCSMYIRHGGDICRGWPALLSPLYQPFPVWVQHCPRLALVCSQRHRNKNKPWNSRLIHAFKSYGLCGGNNGAFRYSQNKKERRPGISANRGNGFNAAVFTEAAPGGVCSQTGGWG